MSEGAASTCARCQARLPPGRLEVCPRCAFSAELPPALVGDSLELVEEIGRGGMGSVWRARQLRLGRTVAVKFLHERLHDEPEAARRFEREAQALARLHHPRIVAVHDFGRDEGRPYIVMEHVEGEPLSESLPLPVDRARQVALDVLDALAYAHAQGVVHRDIKPANVLLETDGRAKVTDFGIARLLVDTPAGATLTAGGSVVGTPAYMAPEILAGARPGPGADIYAVGVLLHEMVTGRRPRGRADGLPEGLARVVARAIAPDPADRYASADEMRAELAAVDLATSEGLPPDERHWLRAVALVQTLATAAVAWAFLLSVTPRVLSPDDVQPLIMLHTERLPDGRVVSHGRFETWPTLAAVGLLVVALVAQALLRRHWREAGLEARQPERAIAESRLVLGFGVTAVLLYGLRRVLAPDGAFWTAYVPIAGGVLELAVVFFAWTAVLQAWRTARPLVRERALWAGIVLALIPPVVDLGVYLQRWKP